MTTREAVEILRSIQRDEDVVVRFGKQMFVRDLTRYGKVSWDDDANSIWVTYWVKLRQRRHTLRSMVLQRVSSL